MTRRMTSRLLGAFIATITVMGPQAEAHAAGWDTPIIYTARQLGMGGTAIAGVRDPSASFHNPAGYQGIEGLEVLGNLVECLQNRPMHLQGRR